MAMEQPDLFNNFPGLLTEKPGMDLINGNLIDNDLIESIERIHKLSSRVYQTITSAQMNEALAKTDLEHYIQKLLSKACQTGSPEKSLHTRSEVEKAAFDRGDPVVRTVLDAAYKVDREIHRLMGLLRFKPRSDGIWLAYCAPDNFILPVFAEHFTARFGEAPWAIIDEKRELALVRLQAKSPCLGILSSFPFLFNREHTQDNWEELWRSYHRSINIQNRRNPALQLQFMPRRYWKYLPELNNNPVI